MIPYLYQRDKYYFHLLPKKPDSQILVLGCGTGDDISWLNERGYAFVLGLDTDPKMIEECRKRKLNASLGNEYSALPGYDMVFAKDVLEHGDPQKMLIEIKRILNPGGVLIGQTPNALNLFWGRLRHGDIEHKLSFTKRMLTDLLKEHFQEVQILSQRPLITGIKSFVRYVLWRGFELLFNFYLLVERGEGNEIFTQNIIFKAQ